MNSFFVEQGANILTVVIIFLGYSKLRTIPNLNKNKFKLVSKFF